MSAGAHEHHLALLLELVQRRIRVRQRQRAFPDRVGERANAVIREQQTLKRRQIVEEPLRRRVLNLRVIGERAQCLLLKRPHTGIELVSTEVVRRAWPWGVETIGSRESDVVDCRHGAPHVHERLVRQGAGHRIDEPHCRRQRKRDPDEPVLAKIAEIAGALALGAEIIRVNRPEQRVVGLRIPSAPPLEELESRLGAGRRELEVVGRHVAVGARASVGAETTQPPVEERAEASQDGVARLAAAEERPMQRSASGRGLVQGDG